MVRSTPTLVRLVRHVRQNHALEHATMRVLADMGEGARLAGCAVGDGFLLLGPVHTEAVETAVFCALRGLAVDPGLAVHPRCGTNLAVLGLIATGLLSLAELVHSRGVRVWLLRGVALGVTALLARPAGFLVQRYVTTSGYVDGVHVAAVRPSRWGDLVLHYVVTRHDG